MANNVITAENDRIVVAMQALKKSHKCIDKIMKECRPTFGGERYLTDKELSALLKVSRRTLQDYRNERRLPYIIFGGKVLYRESDIEQMLNDNYRKAIP